MEWNGPRRSDGNAHREGRQSELEMEREKSEREDPMSIHIPLPLHATRLNIALAP